MRRHARQDILYYNVYIIIMYKVLYIIMYRGDLIGVAGILSIHKQIPKESP